MSEYMSDRMSLGGVHSKKVIYLISFANPRLTQLLWRIIPPSKWLTILMIPWIVSPSGLSHLRMAENMTLGDLQERLQHPTWITARRRGGRNSSECPLCTTWLGKAVGGCQHGGYPPVSTCEILANAGNPPIYGGLNLEKPIQLNGGILVDCRLKTWNFPR